LDTSVYVEAARERHTRRRHASDRPSTAPGGEIEIAVGARTARATDPRRLDARSVVVRVARLSALIVLLGAAWCAPASAGVLVFQRPAIGDSAIVVARGSDGGAARMVGRGADPVVSPNGLRVAFIKARVSCPPAFAAGGGCGRLLVADLGTGTTVQIAPYAQAPIVWSADSHYLASQDSDQNNVNAQVIRLRDRRRRVVRVGSSFGALESIAFSPSDSQVLACDDDGGTFRLSLAATVGGRARSYGAFGDCWATWSRFGLAYITTDATRYSPPSYANVVLRPGLRGSERIVGRFGAGAGAALIGWSATGELLAATDDTAGVHAVVITRRSDTPATLWASAPAATGVAVDAISRNGTRLLVEQNDQVLAVDVATGATSVLETNAAGAGWTD
jgi:hypothetical protein